MKPIHPIITSTTECSMGLIEQWKNKEVDYWYELGFLINYRKLKAKGIEDIPLDIDKETKQVRINWGILHFLNKSK